MVTDQRKLNISSTYYGTSLCGLSLVASELSRYLPISNSMIKAGLISGIGIIALGMFSNKNKNLENIKTILKNDTITIQKTIQKSYGIDYIFKLPTGMCLTDFENKKEHLEQYFDANIKLLYKKNKIIMNVFTKKLKESYPFLLHETKNPIELVLGYGLNGIRTIDMTKHVHLLVAGETGAGKSVFLRSMITALILTKPNLIINLVDFKRVELGIFKKCTQIHRFSTDTQDFESLLDELTIESEKRYRLFESKDLVNITSWNKVSHTKLPYILTIVDEFASLEKEKEIMTKLKRRLEKDRACGIHYVLCCQRPSAKIIDGDIKANIPTILGFKTLNKVNSQIILDDTGCEKLRGNGEGLLKHGEIEKIQTMYLSEEEAKKLIQHTFIKEKEIINNNGVINIGNEKRSRTIRKNRKV